MAPQKLLKRQFYFDLLIDRAPDMVDQETKRVEYLLWANIMLFATTERRQLYVHLRSPNI